MRYFTAFSGIGVFEHAVKDFDWDCVGYSEIDTYATSVYRHHYPIHTNYGDIAKIETLPDFDLLVAGFPCQSFSGAGNRKGFDDPRGQLFHHLMRVFHEKKPKYFLFENVASMTKENRDILSSYIGVEPVMIDAALVSGQSRKRLYWCNWPVQQPDDLGITLQSVLEEGVTEREKSYCIDACYYKGGSLKNYIDKYRRQLVQSERRLVVKSCALRTRDVPVKGKYLEVRQDDKANALTHSAHTSMVTQDLYYRKLTPIECERLQCLPDDYTKYGDRGIISNTQRYKQLGNSFNAAVIRHIIGALYET